MESEKSEKIQSFSTKMAPAPIDIDSPGFRQVIEFILEQTMDVELIFITHPPDTIEVNPVIPGDLEFLQKVLPRRYGDWHIFVRL